jgi:ankyrin repeat protein
LQWFVHCWNEAVRTTILICPLCLLVNSKHVNFCNTASPNSTAIRGSTALIQACHFGKLEVVKELIKHGASIEQSNYKNTTALMRASQEGHEVRELDS